MKKITSLTAAFCMATVFCGFCAGCASEIDKKDPLDIPSATAVESDDSAAYKVILCPGYQLGYGTAKNTVEGLTALSSQDEEKYWVSNAYYASGAAGTTLPKAITTRVKTTFDGWAYTKDGVVVQVDKIPSDLTEDLILYAQWHTTE